MTKIIEANCIEVSVCQTLKLTLSILWNWVNPIKSILDRIW